MTAADVDFSGNYTLDLGGHTLNDTIDNNGRLTICGGGWLYKLENGGGEVHVNDVDNIELLYNSGKLFIHGGRVSTLNNNSGTATVTGTGGTVGTLNNNSGRAIITGGYVERLSIPQDGYFVSSTTINGADIAYLEHQRGTLTLKNCTVETLIAREPNDVRINENVTIRGGAFLNKTTIGNTATVGGVLQKVDYFASVGDTVKFRSVVVQNYVSATWYAFGSGGLDYLLTLGDIVTVTENELPDTKTLVVDEEKLNTAVGASRFVFADTVTKGFHVNGRLLSKGENGSVSLTDVGTLVYDSEDTMYKDWDTALAENDRTLYLAKDEDTVTIAGDTTVTIALNGKSITTLNNSGKVTVTGTGGTVGTLTNNGGTANVNSGELTTLNNNSGTANVSGGTVETLSNSGHVTVSDIDYGYVITLVMETANSTYSMTGGYIVKVEFRHNYTGVIDEFQSVVNTTVDSGLLINGKVLEKNDTAVDYYLLNPVRAEGLDSDGQRVKYYDDLSAAFADGGTVRLLANVDTITVANGTTVTIDLNGKTIGELTNHGNLTITGTDGTVETLKNCVQAGDKWVSTGGTVTVTGGTVTELNTAGQISPKANLTMLSDAQKAEGKVTITGGSVDYLTGENAPIVIEGGTIEEVNASSGTFTMSKGTVDKLVVTTTIRAYEKTDGTITLIDLWDGFNGKLDDDQMIWIPDGSSANYCFANDRVVKAGEAAPYSSLPYAVLGSDADGSNSSKYTDVGAAITAGREKATLLGNVNSVTVNNGKTIIIDLNGKTITDLKNRGSVTVSGTSGTVTALVNNTADSEVTVNGSTVTKLTNKGTATVSGGEVTTIVMATANSTYSKTGGSIGTVWFSIDYTGTVADEQMVKLADDFIGTHVFLGNRVLTSQTAVRFGSLSYAVANSSDGTKYASVDAAIDANVDSVKLLGDMDTVTIGTGKTITIDLNGKTITGLGNEGTVTITDTGTGGTVATLNNKTNGEANVKGGTVMVANNEGTIIVSENGKVTELNNKTNGTANVTGGTVTTLDNDGKAVINGGTVTTLDNSGTAEVKGGEVDKANNEGTITVSENGKVTTLNNLTNGEAKVNGGEVITLDNDSKTVINGGTVGALNNSGEATITDGSITDVNNSGEGTVSISGGFFTENVGEFVDPESGIVAEKDGTYAVNDSIWQLPGLDAEDAQLNIVHVPEKGVDLTIEEIPETLVIKNDTETTIYINNHIIAGGEEGKLSEFPVRSSGSAGYETANGKYFVLKGGNANWTSGSSEGLMFTLNASDVIKVLIDGVEVEFTITDDGKIEIAAEVLNALEKGEHEVTFVFADGQCSTTISIV